MNNKSTKKIKWIAFLALLTWSFIEFGIGFTIMLNEKNAVDNYFNEENIIRYNLKIPTRDNSHIAATIYLNSSWDGVSDESVPTIIFIAGANNQKSTLLDKKIKLLRQGYAIVAMDQRGHGESGGYFSLYEKEYNDVSDVITYLDNNFNQLNCTNIGLIGMSLGGGAVIGAQALDDRVFVTVAYHPASNLTDLFDKIGVDPFKYFGFLPGMSYPYEIPFGFPNWKTIMNDTMYYRNSINLVNETNTKNLLLLHGMEDNLIHPNNSIAIVNKTDPLGTREDIEIILRPGLGHGPNEQNDTSLKYTIAWFNHFYFNDLIDLTNLDQEIEYIELYPWEFPQTGNYLRHFISFALIQMVSFFIAGYIIYNPLKKEDFFIKDEANKKIILTIGYKKTKLTEKITERQLKNVFIQRLGVILFSFLISGLYAAMRNPSLIFGIFLYPLFVAIPGLLLCPVPFTSNRMGSIKTEFKHLFQKQKLINYFLSIAIFVMPIVEILILQYIGGISTINEVAAPEFNIALSNILLFTFLLILPFLILRDLPPRYIVLLLPLMFAATLIIEVFVPFEPIPLVPIPHLGIVFGLLIGVIYTIVYIALLIVRKIITRNLFATLTIIGFLVSTLIWMRFMRII